MAMKSWSGCCCLHCVPVRSLTIATMNLHLYTSSWYLFCTLASSSNFTCVAISSYVSVTRKYTMADKLCSVLMLVIITSLFRLCTVKNVVR